MDFATVLSLSVYARQGETILEDMQNLVHYNVLDQDMYKNISAS